jgi:hypothetical protein
MSLCRKKYLSSMVLADYALILAFYMLLAFTGIFAFKEINDLYTLNFQVRYHQCCGSGMFIRIRIKEFMYFSPKKLLISSRKYDPGCSSRIPDPGVTGSRIRITGYHTILLKIDCK